jgi:hypothetical protein
MSSASTLAAIMIACACGAPQVVEHRPPPPPGGAAVDAGPPPPPPCDHAVPPLALEAMSPQPAGYPIVFPKLSDRDAKAAAFRAQNPGQWDNFGADRLGFISFITRDPTLVAQTADQWRAFLDRNGAFFGIDGPLAVEPDPVFHSIAFVQRIDGVPVARIDVEPTWCHPNGVCEGKQVRGHFWPRANLPKLPAMAVAQIREQLHGAHYTVTREGQRYPCDPPPNEQCERPYQKPSKTFTLDEQAVRVDRIAVIVERDDATELRWAILATLGTSDARTEPIGCAPTVPALIDAVTGESLADRLRWCAVDVVGRCIDPPRGWDL